MPETPRPHVRYRDLRGRLPTMPPAECTSRRNPDRHIMNPSTTFRTLTRVPRWSSPSHASACPDNLPIIAFHVVRVAKTHRQRSIKVDESIQHAQSRHSHAPPTCIHPPRRNQIPIARSQPSLTSRGFLPWRLSDNGPGASRIVAMGRRPKPCTKADVRNATALPDAQMVAASPKVMRCPL